jgi:alpha-tubulin suppressor-like RCC1 family protein
MKKIILSTLIVSAIMLGSMQQVSPPHVRAATNKIVAWGSNSSGESTVPSWLTYDVKDVAAGNGFAVALRTDGTVAVWGNNPHGVKAIPTGLNSVTQITAGWNQIIALKANKTLIGWGDNSWGQLDIPAVLRNVIAVSLGYSHAVALLTNGTVRAWGDNGSGQTDVPAGLAAVIAVSAGSAHTLALRSNGTVVAWGQNFYDESNPPAGLRNVIAIATGSTHSLALKRDGTVVAWGSNLNGESTVPRGLSGVVAITAGGGNSAALKADGTVTVWGENIYGQKRPPKNLSNVVKLRVGYSFLLAVTNPSAVIARTMTRSKTHTHTHTPSVTKTATPTPSRTPTPVPPPIMVRQTNEDGSRYNGRGIVFYSGGGQVYLSAQNVSNKTLTDLDIRFSETTGFYTANCFYQHITKLDPGQTKLVGLSFLGLSYDTWGNDGLCNLSVGTHYGMDGVVIYYLEGVRKSVPVSISFRAQDPAYQTPTPSRTPTATRTPHPAVLRNAEFESGRKHWTTTTKSGASIIQKLPPISRGGDWLAMFGDANNESAVLKQTFYVLPNQDRLTFWYKLRSTERCGFTYDPVRVLVNDVVKWQLDACYYQASAAWQSVTIRLPSATNVTVTFDMRTNNTNPSVWFVDDLEVW